MFRFRAASAGAGQAAEEGGRLDAAQLRRLLFLLRPYRLQLSVGMVAVAIAGILGLALPLLARELFNDAFEARGVPARLDRIALALFAVFAFQAAFNFLRVYLLGIVGEGVVADLRKQLFSHLLTLPVPFFDSRKTGELTSRLTSDVATIQAALSQAIAQLVSQVVTLLGATVVLFVLNARLTLVMLAVIPPVIVAGAVFGRRLRRTSTRFQDRVGDANADAEEALAGIRVVKSFTGEELHRGRYARAVDESFAIGRSRALARALFVPSIILAMFSGIAVVLWYGGRQVLAGALAPGDLIAFLLLTLFVAGSVGAFTGLYSQAQEAIGASRRIFELLDAPGEELATGPRPNRDGVRGGVRFERVSFRYGDRGEELVLDGIELAVEAGESVALVGPSGAGKSTLVSLLPRFYDPQGGRITLDGTDLREFELRELRALIGIVPQETHLFSGSVAENILYGRPEASEAEIREAARAANADEFIHSFPDGYETVVGERGLNLSGGQRQRVAIARALLKDPRILILDEATSSLDSESESLVQAALERLMAGRTNFVIAHRLATVLRADRIVVLDRGRVVEQGDHASLLARGGLYRDLYRRQFDVQGQAAG